MDEWAVKKRRAAARASSPSGGYGSLEAASLTSS